VREIIETTTVAPVISLVTKQRILYATSKEVAENFGKEHYHVLRDIQNLLEIDKSLESNFGCIENRKEIPGNMHGATVKEKE